MLPPPNRPLHDLCQRFGCSLECLATGWLFLCPFAHGRERATVRVRSRSKLRDAVPRRALTSFTRSFGQRREREKASFSKEELAAPRQGQSSFLPPLLRPLDASQMKESFFGSGLSYEDLIENFFSWSSRPRGNRRGRWVSCYILESKPGKGARSSYSKVRTWVDSRRLIPLRIEKYLASGQLAQRIETSNVVTDDIGVRFQRT